MRLRFCVVVGCSVLTLAAAVACAEPFSRGKAAQESDSYSEKNNSAPYKLIEVGQSYLEKGDSEKAIKLFNAAIKYSPDSAQPHFLAGVAYHLEFQRLGAPDLRDNAVIGYQLAARYSPDSPLPRVQLGNLRLEQREFLAAQDEFAKAIELKPDHADALIGFSQAAYLNGDLASALWATKELEALEGQRKVSARNFSVLYAAAGRMGTSRSFREQYVRQASADEVQILDDRLREIEAMHKARQWLSKDYSDQGFSALPLTAQASTQIPIRGAPQAVQLTGDGSPAPPQQPPAPFGSTAQVNTWQGDQSAAPQQPLAAAMPVETNGLRRAWNECRSNQSVAGPTMGAMGGYATGGYGSTGYGSSYGSGYGAPSGGGNGEETQALTALPIPCPEAGLPKMAVIDAVLLRTEDQINHSYGINLLQGLTGFFGGGRLEAQSINGAGENAVGQSTVSTTKLYGIGVAVRDFSGTTPAGAALNYTMNIANATYNRNDVIARPSLIAIDQMPSTFFSGSNLSIAVNGGVGAASTLVDKQVGVSFSITPTILDKDTVLLAVKAVRSFTSQPASGTTGVALSTSRNSVSANIVAKFGETVILSGLTERELVTGNSGVPVLKDIPGVQYLFANNNSTDYFRTILVMITPRKPLVSDEDLENAKLLKNTNSKNKKQYAFYWRIDEFEKVLRQYAPNMDTAIDTLENNQLYKNFKAKDLKNDTWSNQNRLQRLVRESSDLAWR